MEQDGLVDSVMIAEVMKNNAVTAALYKHKNTAIYAKVKRQLFMRNR
jgi:hypothetical protein